MPLKHRHPVKKKYAISKIQCIEEMLGCRVNFNNLIESAEWNKKEVLLLDGNLDIIILNDTPFLTLNGINKYQPTRRFVKVDRVAVRFILNGADIMAPGIIEADPSIEEGNLVWVKNPEDTGIAIGYALFKGSNMVTTHQGKAVETIHHLGDALWKLSTNL